MDLSVSSSSPTVLEKANALYLEAFQLHQQGQLVAAEEKYLEALQWEDTNSDAWNHLGALYLMGEQPELALEAFQHAILLNPQAVYFYHAGLALEQLGDLPGAAETYRQAIALDPKWIDACNNLGNVLVKLGDRVGAEQSYRQAIAFDPTHLGGYLNLGNLLIQQQQMEAAIAFYEIARSHHPDHYDLLCNLGFAYAATNRAEFAIQIYEEALRRYPDALELKVQNQQILPIVYRDSSEVEHYRQRFTALLADLTTQIDWRTPEGQRQALQSLRRRSSFYLQYQGKNDRELQQQCAQLLHRVMATNYPQYVVPRPLPPLGVGEKIRVGYVSHFMRLHTVAKLFLGWLRYANHEQFEVYCYHTGDRQDSYTAAFQQCSDRYFSFTAAVEEEEQQFEAIAQQIVADRLHILVYLDVGMSLVSQQLAVVRLAPVQCMAWGHPITSGSPMIDYFLSSDLMEPPNAQDHYSEILIRLPNLSIAYAHPTLPPLSKTRADFQLRPDAVVYLCCQSLYKYLPQHDPMFVAIARQVPQAQFVFLADQTGPHTTNTFHQRLQQTFAAQGLDADQFCRILPRLSPEDYFALNQLADVYLDTLDWSGGNTTLEAIACGLPVVTCPGEFMRGRHSTAILQQLGVTETIAVDRQEYEAIAIRLGLDPTWRSQRVEQIRQNAHRIYEDTTCVAALEQFYRNVLHT